MKARPSARAERTVTGTFSDKEHVMAAVAKLSERSVPEDAIDVVLIDDEGLHSRQVSSRPSLPWLKGMSWGLVAGAVIGGLLFLALSAGLLGSAGRFAEIVPSSPLAAAFVGVLTGAGLLGPAGALLAIGQGRRTVRISEEEARRNVVAVAVHGDEVADRARRAMLEAGATRVSG